MPSMQSPPKPNVKVQPPFKTSMSSLQKAIERTATQMTQDKIGWHGKGAVASALVQYLQDILLDNYSDGPDEMEEMVESILSTPNVDK